MKPLTRDEVKIRFHLCQLSLNSSVFNRLKSERALSRKWVTYPTVRSEIRTFNIGSGVQQWNENNLFQGRIPNRMIVGLLDTEAFNGHAGFHPFVFRKFGLEWIKQISRGEEYPYETLEIETLQPEETGWVTLDSFKPVVPGANIKLAWYDQTNGACLKTPARKAPVPSSCGTM